MSVLTFGARENGSGFRPTQRLGSHAGADRVEFERSASAGLSKVRAAQRWVGRLLSYDAERSALLRFED